jgi:ankyrin repeat protein
MIEVVLVDSAMNGQPFSPGLFAVAQLFAKPPNAIWEEYQQSRGFSELHEVLLCIKPGSGTLSHYLNRPMEGTTLDLIDATDALGRSALSWAVEYGWVEAVVSLIKLGANVHQKRRSVDGGLSMLHLALAGPDSGQRGTAFLDIVKHLLLAGADVNAVDSEGWTPLHVAASWKNYEAISTLIEFAGQRLDRSAVTSSDESAAQLAANGGGDGSLVELLLSY